MLSKKSLKKILILIFFPVFFWKASRYFPSKIKTKWKAVSLHAFIYTFIGLPLTIALLLEILIAANSVGVRKAKYKFISDFESLPKEELVIPGPKTSEIAEVKKGEDGYYRYLVEKYSPVILQKLSYRPHFDLPVAIDYDGNRDTRDNVANEANHRPHLSTVYGEMLAETEDSYYLAYTLYHIKDYDHPMRERTSIWTYHDNDNEGFQLRIDKESMKVVHVETWFHNRFFICNLDGETYGSEPVQGRINFEDDTHPIIYVQSMGHGVRCAQVSDQEAVEDYVKVMRFRAGGERVDAKADTSTQYNTTYEIAGFDIWYEDALDIVEPGVVNKDVLFEGALNLGKYADGKPLQVSQFIAGVDYARNPWSRPKPPWSWDDKWDEIAMSIWHFFPAEAFASHVGGNLSLNYTYNAATEKVFKLPAAKAYGLFKAKSAGRSGKEDKWDRLDRREKIQLDRAWRAMVHMLKEYVNYVFNSLG